LIQCFLATSLDVVAAAQQPAPCLSTGDDDGRVLLKELEEALLARHECLKPAEHLPVRLMQGA
jgi:hypothetical protein